MGDWVKLTAADGHELSAYVAKPAGDVVGSLIVVQEIFGVNSHIRGVADGYAKDGFHVIAPAIFDRFEPGLELTYGAADRPKAYELYGKLKPETTLMDVAAVYEHVARNGKKVGVVGYCYGGLTAWLVAVRGKAYGMDPAACVGYYPGGIGNVAKEQPACPVMLHFGADDDHVGKDQADAVRQAHPEVEIFVYPGAGHAFNRDADPETFRPEAARLARERTLAFLKEHVG
jgi:carboxymethylenebutenolidase